MNLLVNDISLKKSIINIADTIYTLAKVKKALNTITEQDFLQAEIQYEQSRSELIGNEIRRDKMLRDLLLYLNLDYGYYEVTYIIEFFNSDGITPENKPTLSQDIYNLALEEALKTKSDSTFIIIKPDGQLEIQKYGNGPSSTSGQ